MQLVEQHRIDRHDPRWVAIDAATFASKHLYNKALYEKRQAHIHENHRSISYNDLDKLMQPMAEYRALPAKVAQWVLKQVCAAWDAYFAATAEWHTHPETFKGHPKLQKYLPYDGRNLLVYTNQTISADPKNAGWVVPSGLPIRVATRHGHTEIAQVRIVPKATHYVVEVIYEQEPTSRAVNPVLIASVDLGVNVLAAITSNKPDFTPLLVHGRPLTSCNQAYNKRRAQAQAQLPSDHFTSRVLKELTDKRDRVVTSYLHTASRAIITQLVGEGIGTLVLGTHDGWKQAVHLGKRNNHAFVFMPPARFIQMLTDKAALVGIQVVTMEESHTSKCRFLDLESLQHHDRYVSRRVRRGLFVASTGQALHADVNGSYNIVRRYAPHVVAEGVHAFRLRPIALRLPDRRQDRSKQLPRRTTARK